MRLNPQTYHASALKRVYIEHIWQERETPAGNTNHERPVNAGVTTLGTGTSGRDYSRQDFVRVQEIPESRRCKRIRIQCSEQERFSTMDSR